MDSDLKDLILITGVVIVGAIALGFSLVGMNYYFIDNIPITISVDGKKVFEGRSACAKTVSVGSSSRVDVHGGFLCMFPEAYYAGDNVVITTKGI